MRSAVRAGYIDRSTAATGVGRSAANASSVMTILNAINSILFYTFLSLSAEHRLVPFWFSECPSLLCTFRVCRVASCEFAAAAAVCVDCAGYCVNDLGDLQFDQFIDFRHPHYVGYSNYPVIIISSSYAELSFKRANVTLKVDAKHCGKFMDLCLKIRNAPLFSLCISCYTVKGRAAFVCIELCLPQTPYYVTCGRGSGVLRRHWNTLYISGFVDNVLCARMTLYLPLARQKRRK